MRFNRFAVAAILSIISVASLAGCGTTDVASASTCYLIDESGFLADSVRPDPGYACALTLLSAERMGADTVRPDPGFDESAKSTAGLRPRVKLQQIRPQELKRR